MKRIICLALSLIVFYTNTFGIQDFSAYAKEGGIENEEFILEEETDENLTSIPGDNTAANDVFGEEEAVESDIYVEFSTIDVLKDQSELLQGYLEQYAFIDGMNQLSICAGDFFAESLKDLEKLMYDSLKDRVIKVAAGEVGDTKVTVDIKNIENINDFIYTAASLGLDYNELQAMSSGDRGEKLRETFSKAFYAEHFDYSKVVEAVLRDCPYECYWVDVIYGHGVGFSYQSVGNDYKITPTSITLYLCPSADYSQNGARQTTTVDTSKTVLPHKAIEKAQKIVQEAEHLSDIEKLNYYREQICNLTDYNSEAASSSYTKGYGNPWQLIYVFDEDTNTKVVCEGYSKAFQYLCDLTNFEKNIYSIIVTGKVKFTYSSGGDHMWNILHMDDGKNYLADITNCDANSIRDWLFILPYSQGDVKNGYSFQKGRENYVYSYSDETLNLYAEKNLELSNQEYQNTQSDSGTNEGEENEKEQVEIIYENYASPDLGVAYRSKEDIQNFFNAHPFRLDDAVEYDKEPSLQEPYDVGVLSAFTIERALNAFNTARYIAGLNANVTHDSSLAYQQGAAALINKLNGGLSHSPARPAVLQDSKYDSLYAAAKAGAGSANIGLGHANLNTDIINGWLADASSASNKETLGHRRWVLNPTCSKTAFGVAGNFYSMYSFDRSGTGRETYVVWPAQNMPVELFASNYPWSLSVGSVVNSASVKLTRRRDGKVWNFTSASSDGEFYINNDGYGIVGSISFTPTGLGQIAGDDVFDVNIVVNGNKDVNYTVSFFSLDFSQAKKSIGSTKIIYYDNASSESSNGYTISVVDEKENNKALEENIDYNVTRSGTDVTVTGMNQYYGSIKLYKITYDIDGGEINNNPTHYYLPFWDSYLGLKEPKKTGHSLDGWYSDAFYTNRFKGYIWGTEQQNLSLYAKWTPISYGISFRSNGGTGSMGSLTYAYGTVYTLPRSTMTKTGYKFVGWKENDTGTLIQDGANVRNLASTTTTVYLYAQWEPISYTITFDSSEADSGQMSDISCKYGEKIVLPTCSFQKKGYSCSKYKVIDANTNTEKTYSAGSTVSSLTAIDGGRVTLYPVWDTATIVVYLNSNYGESPAITYVSRLTYGGAGYKASYVYSRTGYKQVSWNTQPDGSGTTYNIGDTVYYNEENAELKVINLYAQWELTNYTINYYNSAQYNNSVNNPTVYNIESDTIILEEPTRTGYSFAGWYTNSSFSTAPITKIEKGSTGNITLYAKWTLKKYYIEYKSSELCTGMMDKTTVEYNKIWKVPLCQFTRLGYEFKCWNTKPDGSGKDYYAGSQQTDILTTEDGATIYLYAQWEPTSVEQEYKKLYFDPNGGLPDTRYEINIPDNQTFQLPENPFRKTGYVFYGWTMKSDGTGTAFRDKASINSSELVLDSTNSLYARWIPITYKIQFHGNGATSGEMQEVYWVYDTKLSLSENSFKKENASFLNWNTKADGTGETYADKASVLNLTDVVDDTIHLYAVWTDNTGNTDNEGNTDNTDDTESAEDWGDIEDCDKELYRSQYSGTNDFWFGRIDSVDYTGKAIKPAVRVYYGKKKLKQGTDYTISYKYNTKAGEATVTATGKGSYKGSIQTNFTINPLPISEAIVENIQVPANGKMQKTPSPVKYFSNGKIITLKKGTDYDLIFDDGDYTDEGEYTVTIQGKGNYIGTKDYQIVIYEDTSSLLKKASIAKAKVVNLQKSYEYTGLKIEPSQSEEFQVYLQAAGENGEDILLRPEEDYTISYQKNRDYGTAAMLIQGINSYTGILRKTFQIVPYDLMTENQRDSRISISLQPSYVYEKGGNTPLPIVKYSYSDGVNSYEKTLDLGKDYTLKYKNNKKITKGLYLTEQSLPTVIITGKGNFKGVYTVDSPITFEITKKSLESITNVTTTDVVYKPKPNICKTTLVITDSNGKKLVAGKDYDKTITYTYAADTWVTQNGNEEEQYRKSGSVVEPEDIIPPDTEIVATVTALEIGNCCYTGSLSKTFRIGNVNISKAKVTVKNTFTHSKEGVWLKQSDLEVKIGDDTLAEKDYTIESHSKNDKAGKATIVIRGKGNYCGTKKFTVNIGARTFLKALSIFTR